MNLYDMQVSDNQRGASERGMDTGTAIARFGRSLPFRGQLKDVRGTTNGEMLTRADLAWKVHTMPVCAMGKTENRVAEGYQALVRGDNGGILSITSDSFKPHQNSDILGDMQAMANEGNAEVVYAGGLDSGRKVVAIAKLEGEFTLPDKTMRANHWNDHSGAEDINGDKTALFAVISGGHEVGTPFKIRALAFRRWCANGVFFTVSASSTYTRSHRGAIAGDRDRIRACYESIRAEFETYHVNSARLQEIAMEHEQSRLYVAELLKPGITADLGARLGFQYKDSAKDVWTEVADSLRGKRALDAIIEENDKASGFARTGKNLLEAITEQDGANGANLWTGYNGVTWFVDHKRGRNVESGTDASLFGAGAVLKERALATALTFA